MARGRQQPELGCKEGIRVMLDLELMFSSLSFSQNSVFAYGVRFAAGGSLIILIF
jgi:hypothetical protein